MTSPGEIDDPFARHIRQARAIDAAWRRIVCSTAATIALAPFVEEVMTKCPDGDAAYVRGELKRRLENYRPQRQSRYRWVRHPNDKSEVLHAVGINGDGTLYNPNGYPEELVRAAVLAADARKHEKRSAAAKRAAETRRARIERQVYQTARALMSGRKLGPRANCVICRKRLSDQASIERGVGSECWQGVLVAIHALKGQQ